ncbi:MAG: hypothetical protein B6I20_08685 [Bacteroidetes bacterium 4572_117]|nr:MAG: hypothetical protein B6I20_08685 [Bacteroidetes bacterium 4572_117]
MKQDDLNNSSQEEKDKTETTENVKNEINQELDSEKQETIVETESEKQETVVETEFKEEETKVETESEKQVTVVETEAEKEVTTTKTESETELGDVKKESAADLILKKLNKTIADGLPNVEQVLTDVEKDEDVVENETPDSTEKSDVVEEIKNDELVETEKVPEKEEAKKVDYSNLSMEDLVLELDKLLEQSDIQKVKSNIELIKVKFYKKHHANIDVNRKKFVDDGGKIEEFKPEENKLEEKFKASYSVYKERRTEYAVQFEKNKQLNLEKKYKIIDDIKELINGQESMNKTFQDFKDLQKQWQNAGLVPQTEVKKLWDSYHYWVEKFYDYVNLNKELRDLDLKKNLELKLNLCKKAEELLIEPKVVTAFKILQKLHSLWREIGPVPNDKKDELWERFKKATTTINKKHQDYFENLKAEQLNNLKAKTLICEKVEETNELMIGTPKEWETNSKEIIDLQRLWKLIGFAPKKENNQIYSRFRKACDAFFNAKREFYSKHREVEENNLQIKTEFCIQAESMTESTEWRKTTEIYIELQKKWKTIGPVPKKHKDTIWLRFRGACNKFFDNKSAYYASLDSAQDENLELKKALIEKIKAINYSDDGSVNLKKLNDIQKQWTEVGFVPLKNKDEVQNEFRAAIDEVFKKLDIDDTEKMKLNFRSKLENMKSSSKSRGRIRNEREKLVVKLEKLKSDTILWENNIGFFAKSKNADSMIQEFEEKIKRAKATIKILKEQLDMIDELM